MNELLIKVPKKYPGKTREDYVSYLNNCAQFAKKCGLSVDKYNKDNLTFEKSGSRWAFIRFFLGSMKRCIKPDLKEALKFLLYDLK